MLLLNAAAGRARVRVSAVLEASPVPVRMVEPGEDLTKVAAFEASRRPPVLAVGGGDGSLAPVAAAARAHDLPFAVVPLGTRNHFARDAGLDRRRPLDALRALRPDAREVRVDVGTVSGRLFLNNVSLGIYADLVRQEGWRRHKMAVVVAHGLREATILLVANNAYGPGTVRPCLDAGVLQVCRIETETAGELAWVIARVLARGASPEECVETDAFRLAGEAGEIPAAIDGEPVTLRAPLDFAIHPGALRLRLP